MSVPATEVTVGAEDAGRDHRGGERAGSAEPPDSDHDANTAIVAAIDVAAGVLRNTRAVCRQSYVHPAVLDAYREGGLQAHWRRSRTREHLGRGESTLLEVLDDG
jgi:DNA topoisomerase IB